MRCVVVLSLATFVVLSVSSVLLAGNGNGPGDGTGNGPCICEFCGDEDGDGFCDFCDGCIPVGDGPKGPNGPKGPIAGGDQNQNQEQGEKVPPNEFGERDRECIRLCIDCETPIGPNCPVCPECGCPQPPCEED